MAIKHFFFGRECPIDKALSDHGNLELELKKNHTNFNNIVFVNQIHGDNICVIDSQDKIHGKQVLPKADGIVTNLKKLAIAIVTADCGAILFVDNENKIVAVVHAGWKGAKLGIISKAVAAMKKLGSKPSEIAVYIGPMIRQDSYQIDKFFYSNFLADDNDNQQFFINDPVDSDHYLFDLPSYIKKKLAQENIIKISDINIDTYKNYQQYASYRKATHLGLDKCDRNISVIIIDE